MTTAITTTEPTAESEFSAFGSIQHFESAQRMAKALYSSSIVPETYRGEGKLGDCIIALEISNRIGASVLAVMQNLYIVHGRPAWSSQFLISCVNASRKFSPLRYKMTGTNGQDDWGCIAWATDKTGEVLESPEVTIKISKEEGWFNRNGSKWKTMPELMLRYRAATFFTRLYAPEITMGIKTDDEVIDIDSTVVVEPAKSAAALFAKPAKKLIDSAAAPAEAAAPAAPAPAPEPAKQETPGQLAKRLIIEAGVPFELFVAEVKARNMSLEADTWPDYEAVPAVLWDAYGAIHKNVANLIKKFGKKAE